jgi:hypothetical protein
MTSNNYCPVEWTDVGSSNQLGMSPPFIGIIPGKIAQAKERKHKHTTFNCIHLVDDWLQSHPYKKLVEYHQSQFHCQLPRMPSSFHSFDAIIAPWAKPTKGPTTHPGI